MSPSSPGREAALDVLRSRRSVRQFTDEPVGDETIRQVIDAARCAPRGGNRLMCRFVVVRSAEARARMADAVSRTVAALRESVSSPRAREQFDAYAGHFSHFASAPCVIAVLARPYDSIYTRIVGKYVPADRVPRQELVDVAVMSVAAAIENLLLAATALGWGTCFMTGPLVAQAAIEAVLEIGEPWHVVALVPIGRPAAAPAERAPEPLDDILEFR